MSEDPSLDFRANLHGVLNVSFTAALAATAIRQTGLIAKIGAEMAELFRPEGVVERLFGSPGAFSGEGRNAEAGFPLRAESRSAPSLNYDVRQRRPKARIVCKQVHDFEALFADARLPAPASQVRLKTPFFSDAAAAQPCG